MYRKGHIGMALILYAPVLFALLWSEYFILAVTGAITMLGLTRIPDKDMKIVRIQSKINSLFFFIDLKKYFGWLFIKHRGVTHTIWFILAIGAFVGAIVFFPAEYIAPYHPLTQMHLVAFFSAISMWSLIAHLSADVLTPSGIHPFAPIVDRKFSLYITTAKNPLWNISLLVVGWGLNIGAVGLWLADLSGYIVVLP